MSLLTDRHPRPVGDAEMSITSPTRLEPRRMWLFALATIWYSWVYWQALPEPASATRIPPPPQVERVAPESPSITIRLAAATPDAAPDSIPASAAVRQVAYWVIRAQDNAGAPFMLIDKVAARLFVFAGDGRLYASSPVLLGAARGDDLPPATGERSIKEATHVRPFERITPAGRFVAERGRNAKGEDIVWIDHDASLSMQRVQTSNPAERRLERLASPTAADNRISDGGIDVPAAFYDAWVAALAEHGRPVVYILPELKSTERIFGPPSRLRSVPMASSDAAWFTHLG